MAEGFSNWNWRDFRTFVSVCEKHGRRNTAAVFAEVAESTEKDEAEVARYFDVFWRRGQELADWTKIEERILKGEQRLQRRESIAKLLATAVKKHANPFQTLKVIYGSSKVRVWLVGVRVHALLTIHPSVPGRRKASTLAWTRTGS